MIKLQINQVPADLLIVTVAEAKEHLKIPTTETGEDTYIQNLIKAAVATVETITNRRLITQTWDYYLDQFPCENEIEIPYPKLQSVTYVKYLDTDGVLQTLGTDIYEVDSNGLVGQIVLLPGQLWPYTQYQRKNTVTIRFVCGYGNASAVPEPIKQAMKLLIGTWYENHETVVVGLTASEVPDTVTLLLGDYRVYTFA